MKKKRELAASSAKTKHIDAKARRPIDATAAPQDANTRIRRVLEVTVDKLDWIANGGLKQAGRPERMREVKSALRLLRDVGRHTLAVTKPKSPRRKSTTPTMGT